MAASENAMSFTTTLLLMLRRRGLLRDEKRDSAQDRAPRAADQRRSDPRAAGAPAKDDGKRGRRD